MNIRNPFARESSSGGSFLPQDYVARRAELRANLLCLGLFGVVMFGVIGAFFVTDRQWLQVSQAQNNQPTVARTTAMAHDRPAPDADKVAAPRFDSTLRLVGVARQNNTIADYLAGLKDCPFLENVDLKRIDPTTIDKFELRKFEIE